MHAHVLQNITWDQKLHSMHIKLMTFSILQLTTFVQLTNEPELGGESRTDDDVSPGISTKESSVQTSQESSEEPVST